MEWACLVACVAFGMWFWHDEVHNRLQCVGRTRSLLRSERSLWCAIKPSRRVRWRLQAVYRRHGGARPSVRSCREMQRAGSGASRSRRMNSTHAPRLTAALPIRVNLFTGLLRPGVRRLQALVKCLQLDWLITLSPDYAGVLPDRATAQSLPAVPWGPHRWRASHELSFLLAVHRNRRRTRRCA